MIMLLSSNSNNENYNNQDNDDINKRWSAAVLNMYMIRYTALYRAFGFNGFLG